MLWGINNMPKKSVKNTNKEFNAMDTKDLYPMALQTRLIYPFFFKPQSIPEALKALG
jgi:hypothetical protein